jgi:alkylation response protein AidB-like acyl-CoA dehydrogenase
MATVESLLDSVKEIAPILRAHSEESEKARRLSRPAVDAMLKAGLYSLSRPKAAGGFELDPVSMFRVVEEVAREDSASGWNLQLSIAAHFLLAWLPEEGAAEILEGPREVILGTSFTPKGQAIPVDGGYRVTGQWPFVSGAHDCNWFLFIPFVMDGDQPRRNDHGVAIQRFVWVPAANASIVDTWYTLGMCGTGSHDVAISDLFVPERHTAPLAPLEQPAKTYQGPLYRLTLWPPIALLAPPALGVARAAINDLIELASIKTPTFTGSPLRERQVVQRQVAEAEATLGAGRAFLHETFRENWEAAVQGAAITLDRKLKMQLATTHANRAAAKAVDLVHDAAGASAIRNQYRFQRYFRDAHTMTQHAGSSTSRYESVGALMLGVQSDWPFFPL